MIKRKDSHGTKFKIGDRVVSESLGVTEAKVVKDSCGDLSVIVLSPSQLRGTSLFLTSQFEIVSERDSEWI